jgi:5-methylcytosine-specific restriction endonuclease McrA
MKQTYGELQQMARERKTRMLAEQRKRRGPKLTKPMRLRVIERDGLTCGICGLEVEHVTAVHIDHVIPVAAGGTNALGNLQVAHARCNLLKGAKV